MWTNPRTAKPIDSVRAHVIGPVDVGVVLLGLLAALVGGFADPEAAAGDQRPPPSSDRLREDPEALAAHVDGQMDELVGVQVPGAAVAIVRADGYGVAAVTTGEPVSADETAFMVGSVGKPTATSRVPTRRTSAGVQRDRCPRPPPTWRPS